MALSSCAVLALMASAGPTLRQRSIPAEDLRTPTEYVAAQQQAGDVVLVSSLSSWGVAYYWPNAHISTRPATTNLQGFIAVPDGIDIVVAGDRTATAVQDALRAALDEQRTHGGRARLWIIREHVNPAESQAWQAAFKAHHLVPRSVLGTSLIVVAGQSPS